MKGLFIVATFAVVLCAGCSKPDAAKTIVGKWVVSDAFKKKHASVQPQGFMDGFALTFWYDFKADKTFAGAMSSGTYTITDNAVSIKTTKFMDKDAPGVEMKGELGADGKTWTLQPPTKGILPAEIDSGIEMSKEAAK